MNNPIYLDHNATTPIDPIVAQAMIPYLYENFGNPSSSHSYGLTAKLAIENARVQVAEMLACSSNEIIFTSGGTESNNHAIRGIANSFKDKGSHIITSQIEHPSVLEVCKYLEEAGYSITYLPVDKYGLVDTHELRKAILPETILISVMHANNEVGTIEPIEEISEIAHEYGIVIHTDCAQTVGKIPVNTNELRVDLLTIAGHKFYGPKGVGALYIRSGTKIEKLTYGADHEMNYRPGTENVLEIVGLGKACELVKDNLISYNNVMSSLRDNLEKGLKERCSDIIINGHPSKRLPNTLSIGFKGAEANKIIDMLPGIAVSEGAACHSERVELSHVLVAMGISEEHAAGTIRFSVGRDTSSEEIKIAIDEISKAVSEVRSKTKWSKYNTEEKIRLTKYTQGLGCACKIEPQILQEVINRLLPTNDGRILVGLENSDDAAVYKMDDNFSIIQTVDFFTPIVDDPFNFGAIAAANSLSDIYAMGGKPLFALNILGFPSNKLPTHILEKIIEGARSKTTEAEISIIGGHSIFDEEPKFGLVVTGIIKNNAIITNANSRLGDDLLLTKPIGTGILSLASQKGLLDGSSEKILIDTMMALNKIASEVMLEVRVNACTDVTGFGLLGHLLEMMNASNKTAIIDFEKIKLLPKAMNFAMSGLTMRGTEDNYNFTSEFVEYDKKLSHHEKLLLNDAQTSGGLLISCSKEKTKKLINALNEKGEKEISIIGEVVEESGRKIRIS